jgi:hypothetical protein
MLAFGATRLSARKAALFGLAGLAQKVLFQGDFLCKRDLCTKSVLACQPVEKVVIGPVDNPKPHPNT